MKKEDDVVKQLEKKNLNKSKLPVVIVCIVLALVVLFAGTWLIYAFAFPKNLAGFVYNRGMDSYALKLYHRDYNKNKDVNSIYMCLNIDIKKNNNEQIVSDFEEFYSLAYYGEFVKNVDEENAKLDKSPLVMASLMYEDNYLKNKYVKALVALNEGEKAIKFAISDGLKVNPVYDNIGNYLFSEFCGKGVNSAYVDYFNSTLGDYGEPLVVAIEDYFDNLYNEFSDKFLTIDKKYVYSVGNRILQVGTNLISLYENDKIGGSRDTVHVTQNMDSVKNKYKLLSME